MRSSRVFAWSRGAVIAVGALLACGLVLPRADAAPQPALIAYEALTGGVFTIAPDGSSNREIIPDANDPVWSPDGSRLLYDNSYGFRGLWSARPDGTDARAIVRPEDIHSAMGAHSTTDGAWSHSGRSVAFVATAEVDEERVVSTIYTVGVDGSRLRKLRAGSEPEWLRGDRRIVAFGSSGIISMRRDGRRPRQLVSGTGAYSHHLDVSPDGRRLAFVETSGPKRSVIRMLTISTGKLRTVTTTRGGHVTAAAWTPDGTRIAYLLTVPAAVGRYPPSSVHTVRADGTHRKRMFSLPFEEHRGLWGEAISWQPRP